MGGRCADGPLAVCGGAVGGVTEACKSHFPVQPYGGRRALCRELLGTWVRMHGLVGSTKGAWC